MIDFDDAPLREDWLLAKAQMLATTSFAEQPDAGSPEWKTVHRIAEEQEMVLAKAIEAAFAAAGAGIDEEKMALELAVHGNTGEIDWAALSKRLSDALEAGIRKVATRTALELLPRFQAEHPEQFAELMRFWANNAVKGKKGFQPTGGGDGPTWMEKRAAFLRSGRVAASAASLDEAVAAWVEPFGSGPHDMRASIAAGTPDPNAKALLGALATSKAAAPALYRGVELTDTALKSMGVTAHLTERTSGKSTYKELTSAEGTPGHQFDLNLSSFSRHSGTALAYASGYGSDYRAYPAPVRQTLIRVAGGGSALRLKGEYDGEWITGGRFEVTGATVAKGNWRIPLTGERGTLTHIVIDVRQVAKLSL